MEEDISLRDLLETIIRGRRIIVGILFFALIMAGILSFFLLPVKYQARATIIFDNKFLEQQGLSIKNYDDLVNDYSKKKTLYDSMQLGKKGYTINLLIDSIKTNVDDKANQIEIVSTGIDPQITQEMANKLGEQSVIDFKRRLIDDKDRQITQLEIQLKDIEKQINDHPKLLGTTEIKSNGGQVIQVPQVNPMYEKLAGRWDEVNNNLNQLKSERDYLNKGIETGGKGLYIILNKAPLPEKPVSPRKMLNTALAGVLGLMAGIFIVFFREFWRKTAVQQGKKESREKDATEKTVGNASGRWD